MSVCWSVSHGIVLPYVHLSVCSSICVCMCLSVSMSVYQSLCWPAFMFVLRFYLCMSLTASVCLPSTCMFGSCLPSWNWILFWENKIIQSVVGRKVDGQILFGARSVKPKILFGARGEKWKNLFGTKWQKRKIVFGSQRVKTARQSDLHFMLS